VDTRAAGFGWLPARAAFASARAPAGSAMGSGWCTTPRPGRTGSRSAATAPRDPSRPTGSGSPTTTWSVGPRSGCALMLLPGRDTKSVAAGAATIARPPEWEVVDRRPAGPTDPPEAESDRAPEGVDSCSPIPAHEPAGRRASKRALSDRDFCAAVRELPRDHAAVARRACGRCANRHGSQRRARPSQQQAARRHGVTLTGAHLARPRPVRLR